MITYVGKILNNVRWFKVYLTAVEKEDQQLKIWRNNPSFRKYFREYRELNSAQQNIWFKNKVVEDDSTQMFAIRN